MRDTDSTCNTPADDAQPDSISMHANVPVWCDCCSCEAEPYWVEALTDEEEDLQERLAGVNQV